MELKNTLMEIGLTEGESKIYLSLLKLGSVPVKIIKEETKIHRTTIYDFLDKLINRGLVGYVVKKNVNYYSAVNPSKLLDIIKEKEQVLNDAIPFLIKLYESEKKDIKIEAYKGLEGIKTILNDIIKTGKDIIGFGIDETKFKELSPSLMEQYFRKLEEKKLSERLLTSKKIKFIFKKNSTTYRYIPEKFFNPTSNLVYGIKTAIIIWNPLTIIVIENHDLADSFKKYFEILWKIAGKK